MRARRTWACGSHGHPGAGPVASAEAGGSAGSGGRGSMERGVFLVRAGDAFSSVSHSRTEAGVQELRGGAGARLPPGEGCHPGDLGRGAGGAAWKPPPRPQARRRPGATKCGDPSERWKELRPALPEMYCRGVWTL